jgi:hypothetical protein
MRILCDGSRLISFNLFGFHVEKRCVDTKVIGGTALAHSK